MKTYQELTPAQQARARDKALNELLTRIVEGDIHYGDGLQKRIDDARQTAEEMQTPWFVGMYIMDTCRDELTAEAQANAEAAFYPEPYEYVITGVI